MGRVKRGLYWKHREGMGMLASELTVFTRTGIFFSLSPPPRQSSRAMAKAFKPCPSSFLALSYLLSLAFAQNPSTNTQVEVYFYPVVLALDDFASYEHTRPTSGGPCTILPQAIWISDDGAVYLLSRMRAILRAQKNHHRLLRVFTDNHDGPIHRVVCHPVCAWQQSKPV